MEAVARSVGIEDSRMVTRSNSKTSEAEEMDAQSDEGEKVVFFYLFVCFLGEGVV